MIASRVIVEGFSFPKNFLNRIVGLVLVLVVMLTTQAFASKKPVGWGDIYSWRDLGSRWAAALDEKGEVIAIYDLSYPDFSGRILLSSLGKNRLSLQEIRKKLHQAREAAIGDGGRHAGRVDSELGNALRKLGDVEQSAGDPVGPEAFSELWWKKLKWVDPAVGENANAPESFRLSDLEVEAMASDRGAARLALERLQRAEDSDSDVQLSTREFLHGFEFSRNADGGYDIYWSPGDARRVSRPKKIADLRATKAGMYKSVGWDVLEEAIDVVTSLFPVPAVANLFGTAIHQYSYFREELRIMRLEMALEMVAAAQEGGPFTAFSTLRPDQLQKVVESILYTNSSLSTVWRWLFVRPAKHWKKLAAETRERSLKGRIWLAEHGETVEGLNERFVLATDPENHKRLYALPRYRLSKNLRPHAAVDFEHPQMIRARRLGILTASVGVDFSVRFIPYFSPIVLAAYYLAVTRPIRTSKRWEARLIAHLEQRMSRGENWIQELEILDGQVVNPFEVSRTRAMELALVRRWDLGLAPVPAGEGSKTPLDRLREWFRLPQSFGLESALVP